MASLILGLVIWQTAVSIFVYSVWTGF